MKNIIFICVFLFNYCQNIQAQTLAVYDSVLAQKSGADKYGMKSYVLVLLKTGSATDTSSATRSKIFSGHMKNINKLAEEKKLVVAGPFGENDKKYEGLFVFNTADVNLAKQWVASDPAIQAKYIDAEFYPFYCSAALMEVNDIHKKLAKESF